MTTQPPDLTQAEVYALHGAYAGHLDARAFSQLERFLEAMSHPEQRVGDARAEAGDALYYPVLRTLAALQQMAAVGATPKPPPAPRRTRREAAREAVIARHAAGEYWRKMVEKAKGG